MEGPAVGLGMTVVSKDHCHITNGRYVYVKQDDKDDILQIFIQEHLDQPLKSEKLPFLLTET